MPKAVINGVELYYRILGEGEPIAFLNGILMTVPSWLIITDKLKHRYRCILHDARGQILSGKPDTDYSMAGHCDDFAKLLDHLDIDACHLVATSYGGLIAQLFASRYPERVKTLILISTAAYTDIVLSTHLQSWIDAVTSSNMDTLFSNIKALNHSSAFLLSHEKSVDEANQKIRKLPRTVFTALVNLLKVSKKTDLRNEISKITAPTLIIMGQEDRLTPPGMGHDLEKRITGSSLILISDAGHAIVFEKPNLVSGLITGFIDHHLPEHP